MKLKYLIIIVLLIAAGCKKETTKLRSDVQGTWELVSSDYAWSGHHDYSVGNGNTFKFNGNTYVQTLKYTDSTLQYSGTFTIYKGKPCEMATEQTLIKFDNTDPEMFSLSNGVLTIGSTSCVADGGYSTYRKIE